MARNKLLPPQPPPAKDPRCTGRTTSIALGMLEYALCHQGKPATDTDHHEPGTEQAANRLQGAILDIVGRLGLAHITVAVVKQPVGQWRVQVQSNIWED